MSMKLFVATHNQHKLREIGQILPGFEIVADDPEGVEENAPDFIGNALIKMRAIAARHVGEWCMADDSGLEVVALGGAPGVFSARYSGEPCDDARNNALLLRNMENVADGDRTAYFESVIVCVFPDGRSFAVSGKCRGVIARDAAGSGGFGYDRVFISSVGRFSEVSGDKKDSVSHRGRALAEFAEKIKEYI